jgi:hypothetical protein
MSRYRPISTVVSNLPPFPCAVYVNETLVGQPLAFISERALQVRLEILPQGLLDPVNKNQQAADGYRQLPISEEFIKLCDKDVQ